MNLFELHERMTKHLFPAYSSEDEHFLALALCGEMSEASELIWLASRSSGRLANMIKKRWRDGSDLGAEIRDEICDCRIYLELLAKRFDIEGAKLDKAVEAKLRKVADKHKERIAEAQHESNAADFRGEWEPNLG